jgi:hypothetical protein
MRIDYPDNSFMLAWDHCRAWFRADGTLKDAEYKRKYRGYPTAVAVSPAHVRVRAWLQKQGTQEAQLLERGILVRRVTA